MGSCVIFCYGYLLQYYTLLSRLSINKLSMLTLGQIGMKDDPYSESISLVVQSLYCLFNNG